MSARHRVAKALKQMDPNASYGDKTITTDNMVLYMFDQERSARIVKELLAAINKRKPLIHNGRKP
ncbi:hypothetical protein ANMWB30_09550 [Arthrobacter sp. MWB30]|nr:hypothetical protein ANMWB30_09550 [Arthrobacter sp. MWB30]